MGKGLFGIDDASDGTLVWAPRFPAEITETQTPFWHTGNCWDFGCGPDTYWLDPHIAEGEVRILLDGKQAAAQVKGERMSWPRRRA